jgi:UDPglucose 6-dehydrogenase
MAEIGHDVACTDTDRDRIGTLTEGGVPFYEPGLDGLVRRNVEAGRLSFELDPGDAIRFGDTIFICVGTPALQDGDADLSAIDVAARLIAVEARSSKLVVEKSTVPTQTGQKLQRVLSMYARAVGTPCSFRVASNPEFLREGTAISDFLHPHRIVIGVEDASARAALHELYKPLLKQDFVCPVHRGECPVQPPPALLVTNVSSAELVKHACNTFLALKISYINLIADICETIGADVDQVAKAMGLDPRIGSSFLSPGLGFGGSCLPKDIQAFIKVGERADVDVSLLTAAEHINKGRVEKFLQTVYQALWVVKNKRIAVLGLAFKAQTDDIRCAPALKLIECLAEEGATIQAYDPCAMERAQTELPNIAYCESAYIAARGAEAIIIATEWEEFRTLDWKRIKQTMARPVILDGRNLLNAEAMAALGFEYHGVGRSAQQLQAWHVSA